MTEESKTHVKGYETDKITTFRNLKGLMIDLLRGYPEYEYFGKFESVFKNTGRDVVIRLIQDKIIISYNFPPSKEGEPVKYRLTPKGINLAISLINLEHSENLIKYSKEMRKFTIAIIIIGSLAFIVGLIQLILKYY